MIYNIFLIYLFLNFILSFISKVMINIADEYWKKREDPPNMNFFKLVIIGTTLIISGKLFYSLGYINGFISSVFLNRSEQLPLNKRVHFIYANIVLPIIKIFIFLPVLIVTIGIEIYYNYFDKKKGDN